MKKILTAMLLCVGFAVSAQNAIEKTGEGFWRASATNGASKWVPLRAATSGIGLKVVSGTCTVELAFESFSACTADTATGFEWAAGDKTAGTYSAAIAGASCARVVCSPGSGTIYVKN